jgi:hypothetical protein
MSVKYYTVNEDQAIKDWSQTIVEATGLDPKNRKHAERLAWMSTMMSVNARTNESDAKSIRESYGSGNPAIMPGMGPVTFPSNPGTGVGATDGAFYKPDYVKGSGDIPGTKLGVSMNTAAYTIGLELLPVIPMEFPTMMYSYLDHLYADGSLTSAETKPSYIQLSGSNIGTSAFDKTQFEKGDIIYVTQLDINAAGVADVVIDAVPAIKAQYYGLHRLTGDVIIKVVAVGTVSSAGAFTANTTGSVSDVVTAVFVGAASAWVVSLGTASAINALVGTPAKFTDGAIVGATIKAALVNSMDEHIPEYSNNAATITKNGPDKFTATRDQGENGTTNAVSLKMFSTSVEAGTVEVIANLTRTQLKDLSAYGIDGMGQIYRAAQNQLTQTINRDILRTMFRMGVTTAAQLKAAQGADFNLFLADAGTASKALADFGLAEFVDITGVDRTGDFTAVKNGETNSSAENLYTRQRRLSSRMLLAKNTIGTVGRNGAGDIAVMNTNLVSAIQDNKNFIAAPTENTITVDTRNLYFVGTLNGCAIYCDPLMKHFDTRIMVGRKGTDEDSGLKMFIYMLSDSIETIDAGSMSPKVVVTSRYSLVPAGFYPHANYITFGAYMDFSENTWA